MLLPRLYWPLVISHVVGGALNVQPCHLPGGGHCWKAPDKPGKMIYRLHIMVVVWGEVGGVAGYCQFHAGSVRLVSL